METILGIRGPDFVMLAADNTQARSILVMKDDENKIHKISNNLMLATVGESGDTVQFTEFISKNIALYKMRNGYDLNPKAAAHFTRKNLAEYLRSRTPYNVNMMLAGYDAKDGPELHYIDYLANARPVKYGGMGYGQMFVSSIFDRYWNENITQEDAYKILKMGVVEINKRMIINLKTFTVAVVDKDGVKFLDKIVASDAVAEAAK